MIIGQSIFQLVVVLVFYFGGADILGYDTSLHEEQLQLDTIIFNMFVWMQIFNELNCRRLDNKFNVFAGIHRNWFFIFINSIMIALQITIVFVGNRVFDIDPNGLDGPQWAISVLVAAFSLPWGIVVRLFPDEWFAKCVYLVAPPFVISYRFLGKVLGQFSKLFNKFKKLDVESQSESSVNKEREVEAMVAPPATAPFVVGSPGEKVQQ